MNNVLLIVIMVASILGYAFIGTIGACIYVAKKGKPDQGWGNAFWDEPEPTAIFLFWPVWIVGLAVLATFYLPYKSFDKFARWFVQKLNPAFRNV